MLYSFSVQPCSVEVEDKYFLQISPSPSFKINSVSWVLTKITFNHEEYNGLSTSYTESIENNSLIDISLARSLSPGIYRIDEIIFNERFVSKKGTSGMKNDPVLFEVRKKGQMPKEPGEIADLYSNLQNIFKQEYLRGIGEGENSYSVILVIEGIITCGYLKLGTCNIQPLAKNNRTHIKRFLHKLASYSPNSYMSHFLSYSYFKKFYFIPGAINYTAIHYPHVKSDNAEEAKLTAENEVELILQLLNVCCMRKGRVIGAYITDNIGETIYRKCSLPDCSKMSNTIILYELMYKINSRLKDIKASDRLKLIMTLHNEALQEENAGLKYYKYLNLLLIIAKNRNYPGYYAEDRRTPFEINVKRTIEITAENERAIVWKLTKDALKTYKIDEDTISILQSGESIIEIIYIWFQRRNCMFNEDECLCRNPNLTSYGPRALRCKNAGIKAIEKYSGRDLYIELLRDVSRIIVMKELKLNNK